MKFGGGAFSQDAQGHWFINVTVKVPRELGRGVDAVGIDLGLKDLAALSNGRVIENPRWYQRTQARLACAQRANKKRQARKLHAKIAAQRADYLHKESTRIVQEHGAIFVGNVNPSAIAKTNMGKSSLNAGWSMFKQQLEYKAITRGVLFAEVNEAFSTQTCSSCGSVEGPKGAAGLGIREWRCSCGTSHQRDTNAAVNILRRGLATLAEGAAS
jgi:IS605 OrfB family transposase